MEVRVIGESRCMEAAWMPNIRAASPHHRRQAAQRSGVVGGAASLLET